MIKGIVLLLLVTYQQPNGLILQDVSQEVNCRSDAYAIAKVETALRRADKGLVERTKVIAVSCKAVKVSIRLDMT